MAGGNSYNGWPASDSPSAIQIDTKFGASVGTPGYAEGGYVGGLKSGDVSTVFRYLIGELKQIDPPGPDEHPGYGCWGYSYRANVNNPSQLSCHASGTAIDWRAPWHPNGTSTGPSGGGGFTGSQYSAIQAVLNGPLQGCIRWLTSNDPMHFEIYGNASKVAGVAASLGGSVPPSTGDWFDMATRADLDAAIAAAIPAIAVAVWQQTVSDRSGADLLNNASVQAQRAAENSSELGVKVWTTPITDETANTLLARAANG